MPRGGKRPGAGRPNGARGHKVLAREALKAYFEEQTCQAFAVVVKQYLKLAKDGNERVLIDLLNRLLGKPPDSFELSSPAGALPVRIVHEHHPALTKPDASRS